MILGYTINNKHVTVQESYIKNVLCIAISDLLILLYSDNLVSFHTGLISRPGNDPINPEQLEDIGLKLQKDLDGGKYKDVMSTMIKDHCQT